MELSEFNIEYRPRTAIKGQVLDDFSVERFEVENKRWTTKSGYSKLMGHPELKAEASG